MGSAVLLLAPLATLWAVWQIPDGVATTASFLGYTIEPVEGSPLRRLFATIFAVMAFTGALFAYRQAKWYELAAAHAYAAGAVGVAFAGDLITLSGDFLARTSEADPGPMVAPLAKASTDALPSVVTVMFPRSPACGPCGFLSPCSLPVGLKCSPADMKSGAEH